MEDGPEFVATSKASTTNSQSLINDNFYPGGRSVPSIINQQAVYLSIVAILGILGNVIVIFKCLLPKRKRLKRRSGTLKMSSANYFVVSLCLSNLGTLTVSLSFTMLPYYIASFPITQFSCRYILPSREFFIAVSIYSVAFIAIDSYLTRFKAFSKNQIPSFYLASVVLLWIVCYLMFALPFTFVYKVIYVDGAYVCDTVWSSATIRRVYLTFLVTFNVLLPGMTVFVCYVAVIRNLNRIRRRVIESGPMSKICAATYIMAKSKKIITVALMMVTAFIITYCPYALLVLILEFEGDADKYYPNLETCAAIALCLLFSSAVIFPYILIFTRRSFKVKTDPSSRLPVMINRGFSHD